MKQPKTSLREEFLLAGLINFDRAKHIEKTFKKNKASIRERGYTCRWTGELCKHF